MENPIPASDFPGQTEPKKSRTGLIIGIVVVVLCCCCLVFGGLGYYLWNNGDDLLRQLGMVASLF